MSYSQAKEVAGHKAAEMVTVQRPCLLVKARGACPVWKAAVDFSAYGV